LKKYDSHTNKKNKMKRIGALVMLNEQEYEQ